MANDILNIRNLQVISTAESQPNYLVNGVSLRLEKGQVLGLIGESGAGKTTIGLAALAYCRPGCAIVEGEITFGEAGRIKGFSAVQMLRGRRISYVAQSAAASFNPSKTIYWQFCEMPLFFGIMKSGEAAKWAVELFRSLDLPSPETFGNRYPHQVSGGQLQRAMVAMAMSCRPDIIVFDEPTTALDVTTQIEVLASIRKVIKEYGTAGLYISHDLAVVAQIADHTMVLRNGSLIEYGPTRQILEAPVNEYTRRLVSVRKTGHFRTKAHPQNARDTIMELRGVDVFYGRVAAVKNASFAIRRGETVAVVGESGSGKTTLGRAICGLCPSASGQISYHGEILSPDFRARTLDQKRGIQLIYQMPDVALNPRQTVEQIISAPLIRFFKMGRTKIRVRVNELLSMLDLPEHFARRRPGELSGGQKQRVCIARALAAEPDIIICDEITSALDGLVGEEILKLLFKLQSETGVSYLFISHDIGTVRRIADDVLVMLKGKIVARGPLSNVFRAPNHPYTELLLASVPEMRSNWLDEALLKKRASAALTTKRD